MLQYLDEVIKELDVINERYAIFRRITEIATAHARLSTVGSKKLKNGCILCMVKYINRAILSHTYVKCAASLYGARCQTILGLSALTEATADFTMELENHYHYNYGHSIASYE